MNPTGWKLYFFSCLHHARMEGNGGLIRSGVSASSSVLLGPWFPSLNVATLCCLRVIARQSGPGRFPKKLHFHSCTKPRAPDCQGFGPQDAAGGIDSDRSVVLLGLTAFLHHLLPPSSLPLLVDSVAVEEQERERRRQVVEKFQKAPFEEIAAHCGARVSGGFCVLCPVGLSLPLACSKDGAGRKQKAQVREQRDNLICALVTVQDWPRKNPKSLKCNGFYL